MSKDRDDSGEDPALSGHQNCSNRPTKRQPTQRVNHHFLLARSVPIASPSKHCMAPKHLYYHPLALIPALVCPFVALVHSLLLHFSLHSPCIICNTLAPSRQQPSTTIPPTRKIPLYSSQSPKDPPPARASRPAAKFAHPGQLEETPLLPLDYCCHSYITTLEERCIQQDELIQQYENRIKLLESQLLHSQSQTRYRHLLREINTKVSWLVEEVEAHELCTSSKAPQTRLRSAQATTRPRTGLFDSSTESNQEEDLTEEGTEIIV